MTFKKASGSLDTACVEVDLDTPGRVLVRNSKHVDGPVIVYTTEEWRAFLSGVNAGEFDIK